MLFRIKLSEICMKMDLALDNLQWLICHKIHINFKCSIAF